jgi:uncharacterized protein
LTHPTPTREPFVDALRALALLGVFLVNALGYPYAPDFPIYIGLPTPIHSSVAILLDSSLIAFVQGKAWPLLCFLFGYSMCILALKARADGLKGLQVNRLLRTRYFKLLIIGFMHGFFIYFGDILTLYALCGLLIANLVLKRSIKILKIRKWFSVINIISIVLVLIFSLTFWFTKENLISNPNFDEEFGLKLILGKFMADTHMFDFLVVNSKTYLDHQIYSLLILPTAFWLILSGILVCRFRLFSNKINARNFWKNHIKRWQFICAILVNIGLGILSWITYSADILNVNKLMAISLLGIPAGVWLSATCVAEGMRYWHKTSQLPRWMLWLAPAGKHTLAMYLTLSVTLMLTSGAFLGLQGSTMDRFIVVLLAWVGVVSLARYATKLGIRDPFAHWMSANYSGVKASDLVKISNSNK